MQTFPLINSLFQKVLESEVSTVSLFVDKKPDIGDKIMFINIAQAYMSVNARWCYRYVQSIQDFEIITTDEIYLRITVCAESISHN